MQIIEWRPGFEIGLEKIDEQHRQLFVLTNRFGEMLSNDQVDPRGLKEVFSELLDYTRDHFKEEEQLMESQGIDAEFVSLHQDQHRSFLNDVQFLAAEMHYARTNGEVLFEFLMGWLVFHILGTDSSLGRQVALIREGVPAREAHARQTEVDNDAAGMLLNAMNNLFHQVSLRNRELNELNQTLEQKVEERTRDLSKANQRLGELASTDVLTGLSNRRHALQLLETLWLEKDGAKSLSCMMIDADGFKQVNDRYGHDAGDRVLCELARTFQHLVRTDDIVCRLGGDEFLILCPGTDAEGVRRVAEQVHAGVEELQVAFPGGAWHGSISVGIATRTPQMQVPGELIKEADRAVYVAKESGKNCVREAS